MQIFGENVKKLRVEKGFSQKEFGDRVGVAQTTVANYENGKRFPTGEVLINIALVLGTSTDYLLGLDKIRKKRGFASIDHKYVLESLKNAALKGNESEAIKLLNILEPDNSNIISIYKEIILAALNEIKADYLAGDIDTATKIKGYNILYGIIGALSNQYKVLEKDNLVAASLATLGHLRGFTALDQKNINQKDSKRGA